MKFIDKYDVIVQLINIRNFIKLFAFSKFVRSADESIPISVLEMERVFLPAKPSLKGDKTRMSRLPHYVIADQWFCDHLIQNFTLRRLSAIVQKLLQRNSQEILSNFLLRVL